jgi:hypothetical protein
LILGLATRGGNQKPALMAGSFTVLRPVSTRAFYRDEILRGGNLHRQDIEEGFSSIERAATMSIACENRAALRSPRRKTL